MDVNDTRRARSRALARLGLVLALGLGTTVTIGCGGDDDQSADVFIGTWQVIEGNATARCTGLSPTSSLGGAQVKMTAGSDAPLQVDVRGCLLKFDINGTTASARPDQMCKTTFDLMGANLAVDLTVMKADFTVTGMNGLLTMTGTATTPFLGATGCPYDAMAMATKTAMP
jgi:hypothetical protein